ncbi:hypothetical protein [Chryseobacterium sp. VAUSW3]|uniref:hypothetical protein n=1 Tax=Chryseobacterium sp. VAUSW3 TaxID=2010998 RepID=UPI000B4C3765|nr:hypothetical protein [Chryseobacterium sp. VAUSW3]OWR14139.1 hypothetical protein CDW55_07345 [Chryseobacterium sp. VAUSW3]
MKLIYSIIFVSFTSLLFSQKFNSENYYENYGKKEKLQGKRLATAWLNEIDAAQILSEEMKNAGFEWVREFRIIKVNENEHILAICYSEKSKVGFVYEPTHGAFPKKQNRELKSLLKRNSGNDYSEKIVDLNGNSQFIKIKDMPDNIFIIKEDIYWFQFTDNKDDDKYLVTKNDMLEIFREDIRKVIAKFKK